MRFLCIRNPQDSVGGGEWGKGAVTRMEEGWGKGWHFHIAASLVTL